MRMGDVATIVGARPQFVKCALVSKRLRASGQRELLIHTGQHYDDNLSAVFFDDLEIPAPDVNLGVGSGTHGRQTGSALIAIEEVLLARRPDVVVVYGDTNSTLAGALASTKLRIPTVHVESGLRSFDRSMPEELNRVATDHLSDLLLCHSESAADQLRREAVGGGIQVVGDVMREAQACFLPRALARRRTLLERLGLDELGYTLLTVHRPSNADDPERLRRILAWCADRRALTVFPAHPRVAAAAKALLDERGENRIRLIPPLGYLDALALLTAANGVLTDSGGLQKEAFFLGVPCVTLREETEWRETLGGGRNALLGRRLDHAALDAAWLTVAGGQQQRPAPDAAELENLFGPANASSRIAEAIAQCS